MRQLSLLALLLMGTLAMADEPGYHLSVAGEIRGNILAIAPIIAAPAGQTLRYDIVTSKSGRSGTSKTRQAASVKVSEDGNASLSKVNVSVGAEERCEVSIEVYDGNRLVAARRQTL